MIQLSNRTKSIILKITAIAVATAVCFIIFFIAVVINGYKTNGPLSGTNAFMTFIIMQWVWRKIWKRFSKVWRKLGSSD